MQASLKGASDAFVTTLNASGSAVMFSTYFGGELPSWLGGERGATALAIDAAGNIVFGGFTNSTDLPIAGALSALSGPANPVNGSYDNDAFVAKLTASGELLFSRYFGGNGWDWLADIALDASGVIYTMVYAGTDGRGVFKSIDGGATWNASAVGIDAELVTQIAVDTVTPANIHIGLCGDAYVGC